MNAKITATLTEKGLSLVVNGEPTILNSSHLNYERVLSALRNKEFDKIPPLLDIGKSIEEFSSGHVKVSNGQVFFKDRAVDNSLTKRMIEMLRLGLDIEPMVKFLTNLMQNPSYRSVEQLYDFMEACDLPITEDGRLLCYRSVNSNYWDTHTGKTSFNIPPETLKGLTTQDLKEVGFIDVGLYEELILTRNGVTTIVGVLGPYYCLVSMDRNQVDDNPDNTCSNGLHVCSQKYGMYGSKLLLVAVNPKDVVSVPRDYHNAKMRVCEYEVLKCVQDKGFETYENRPVYDYDEDDLDYDLDLW